MNNLHPLTRKACSIFAVLLVGTCPLKTLAQKDSVNKYQNNYRYAVQLEVSQYVGFKMERVWGKLRKPRLGVAVGVGYSQNPGLFSSSFDFSRGIKKTHLISSLHLLLTVSRNSDIEAGLAGNSIYSPEKSRIFSPTKWLLCLKVVTDGIPLAANGLSI